MYIGRGLSCGSPVGWYTITTCQPTHHSLFGIINIHPTSPIILCRHRYSGFFLFPKLKSTWKKIFFKPQNKLKKTQYKSCTPSPKTCSRKCSKNGRNIGCNVLWTEETTLMGISLNKVVSYVIRFILQKFGLFCS